MGSQIYDAAASYGQATSLISMIVCIIIGCVFLFIGIYLLIKENRGMGHTKATVIDSLCDITSTNKSNKGVILNNTFTCNINISYMVDGKTYTSVINDTYTSDVSTYNIKPNTQIDVTYQLTDPTVVKIKQSNWLFIMFIIIAVLLIPGGIFNYYFTKNNKSYAAMKGTESALGGLSGLPFAFNKY